MNAWTKHQRWKRRRGQPRSVQTFLAMIYWRERARLLGRLIPYCLGRKTAGRAEHIESLELKLAKLREEITTMREAAERHNVQAFATGLIVRCTGCRPGAPEGWEGLTEERVREVEFIARSLRAWWTNEQRKRVEPPNQPDPAAGGKEE
ncbi:MAG: hypothetical protein U0990_09690 [Candidatus Nanopelagicales bacterium]|nr:hypothetical protein [Candidatus Nanopelagicales bacterium]